MKRFLHKLNRIYNFFSANLRGYFWKPCPICGEYFGGHEHSDITLMDSTSSGHLVCKDCSQKAFEANKENFPDIFKNWNWEDYQSIRKSR
jgi:hypothetical protein